QFLPAPAFVLARAGIAVARQVHEVETFVDEKEVDRPGPSWRTADPRQALALHQAVEQTRFPDVRPAHERDLGTAVAGQIGGVMHRALVCGTGNPQFRELLCRTASGAGPTGCLRELRETEDDLQD